MRNGGVAPWPGWSIPFTPPFTPPRGRPRRRRARAPHLPQRLAQLHALPNRIASPARGSLILASPGLPLTAAAPRTYTSSLAQRDWPSARGASAAEARGPSDHGRGETAAPAQCPPRRVPGPVEGRREPGAPRHWRRPRQGEEAHQKCEATRAGAMRTHQTSPAPSGWQSLPALVQKSFHPLGGRIAYFRVVEAFASTIHEAAVQAVDADRAQGQVDALP